MVIDTLENAGKYASLHPRLAQAFEYLKTLDLNALEVGKFEIDGRDLHASVSSKDGVKAEDAKFEAHNSYIDIQLCLQGSETIGWTPRAKVTQPKGEFNTEKDVIFYSDKPEMYFTLTDGQFVIFYPEDVHAPMIGEGNIKKLVVKVKI
ncbi:YhcH/YjgK/YiaL family protein [Paraflavisolibacter sp. H34]|uniref:YhcH/YjgK/YiaL family protein n=1 Tax=Huijunlia imazamoxiresistens TaxID=3127457 RepID=UPI003017BE40